MGIKDKACVVLRTTLQELKEISGDGSEYRESIYRKDFDRTKELSPEHMRIQATNSWYAKRTSDIRIWGDDLERLVKDDIYREVIGGYNGQLADKVFDDVMTQELRVVGIIHEINEDNKSVQATIEVGTETNPDMQYLDKLEDFEEELEGVKQKASFSGTAGDIVWLESFSVEVYTWKFRDIDAEVKKFIKKIIRNELTYCLKKGKVIIPKEYLSKGRDGIIEWRNLKSSSNKNNSMEKRIIKQTYRDKKRFAMNNMGNILNAITDPNHSWKIPSLAIEGRYNQQKMSALFSYVFKDVSKQEFLEMSEEAIVNKMKYHWKKILMDSFKAVEATEIKREQ